MCHKERERADSHRESTFRTSPVVQRLRLCSSNAGGRGGGTKIPHAAWCGQNTNKQTNNNKTKQIKESILKDHTVFKQITAFDLPCGRAAKNLPINAGDICSIPGPGRFEMPQGD